MSSINVTLPDGSSQPVPSGATPLDVARKISPRLADAAIVARVNGELYDLTRPLETDATVEILTSKNPEALEVYRHSNAHLLAAAVLELFPETKLGIGPPTETGFFYDFQRETPFTPDDLEAIEARMWELQKKGHPLPAHPHSQGRGRPQVHRAGRADESGNDRGEGWRRLHRIHPRPPL